MRTLLALWTLALCGPPAAAKETGRRVVVLVDTSSSMDGNDGPRFTVLATQILSDLLDDADALTVIRTPPAPGGGCPGGCARALKTSDRRGSKKAIHDLLYRYQGGTHFGAAMAAARRALAPQDRDELLLFISDAQSASDGDTVTRALPVLHKEGTMLASITLGNSGRGPWRGKGFDHEGEANAPNEILGELAAVYQRFLGARRRVQSGEVAGTIEIDIDPYVKTAFLVVAAEGDIGQLEAGSGNPAGEVDPDFRGGGVVRGGDGKDRSYRIVRLDRPGAGRWRFRAPIALQNAGFLLLQEHAIGLRPAGGGPGFVPLGVDTPLEVELFDERTGRTIDTDELVDLDLTLEVEGRPVPLRDDGTGGDRIAGDGILTVTTRFDRPGDIPVSIHLETDAVDRQIPLTLQVVDVPWRIEPEIPGRVEIDSTVPLRARLRQHSPPKGPPPEVLLAGEGLRLRRTGGDRYEGSWTPDALGTVTLTFSAPDVPGMIPVSREVEVIGTPRPRRGRPGTDRRARQPQRRAGAARSRRGEGSRRALGVDHDALRFRRRRDRTIARWRLGAARGDPRRGDRPHRRPEPLAGPARGSGAARRPALRRRAPCSC